MSSAKLRPFCLRFDMITFIITSLYIQLNKGHVPGAKCYMGCLSETHIKPKSREIPFVYDISFSGIIILKFGTEHNSITAVLCAKF